MSDEVSIVGGEKEPVKLTLSITITQGQSPEIQGPGNGKMYDLPMCLFLLEEAKDIIKSHNLRGQMQEQEKKIVTAPHGLGRVRGMFNGKKH